MDVWTSFARTGDPNHKGIPKWIPYDLKKNMMVLGTKTKRSEYPFGQERRIWEGLF